MKNKIKCDICEKYPAVVKDYRWYNDYGEKFLSCNYCVSLNDEWHYKVRKNKLDPKKVLEEGE